MARRPPQHAVDAQGIFIPADDDAWDNDRIRTEIKALGKNGDRHPVSRYFSGATRFDLNAPMQVGGTTVRIIDYIDDAKKPERWSLRRLDPRDYTSLINRWDREDSERTALAYYDACVIGIEGVENGPVLRGAKVGRLTDSDMQYLVDTRLVAPLGNAVLAYSSPMRPDEGEASGS